MTEAQYSGTPTIAVPLFFDQGHNVAVGVKRGVTLLLSKKKLNEATLTDALHEVLGNEKSVAMTSRMMCDC